MRVELPICRYTREASEQGVALLEFALVAPLLILMLMGIIDTSLLLMNYTKIEQAAREGARTASKLMLVGDPTQALSYSQQDTQHNMNECDKPVPQGVDCNHVLIHARIRAVMRHQHLFSVNPEMTQTAPKDPPPSQIRSIFTERNPSAVSPEPEFDTIAIHVNSQYDGFFGKYPIEVAYQGPWLFERS